MQACVELEVFKYLGSLITLLG